MVFQRCFLIWENFHTFSHSYWLSFCCFDLLFGLPSLLFISLNIQRCMWATWNCRDLVYLLIRSGFCVWESFSLEGRHRLWQWLSISQLCVPLNINFNHQSIYLFLDTGPGPGGIGSTLSKVVQLFFFPVTSSSSCLGGILRLSRPDGILFLICPMVVGRSRENLEEASSSGVWTPSTGFSFTWSWFLMSELLNIFLKRQYA